MARRTTWNVVLVAGQAWALAGLVAGLVGCAVGPDFVKPEVETPAEFQALQEKATAPGTADLVAWWKRLGDAKLDELVERALEENKDLRLASARVLEARAQRGVTAADLFPTVDGIGSATHNRGSAGGGGSGRTGPGRETDLYDVGVDASWEIDFWGRIRRGVESADAMIMSSEEARRGVIVTLLADVATNYVEMRSFQSRLRIAENNVETQSDTLGLTESRFTAGLTSELDVARARTNLATTQSQIPLLQAGMRRSMYRLSTLVGRPAGALSEMLAQVGPIPAGPAQIPTGLPSELLLRRPDVRQSERELAAATARIGVATADLFPRFSLSGSFGFSNGELGGMFDSNNRFWSFGPAFRWPIFQAGRIRSNIKVQDARTEQALITYERAVLNAFEDVETSMVNFGREQDRRGFLAEAVAAADRSTVLATDLYLKGLADFISVLDAQRQLFQLQDQLAASESTVTTNLISVYRALGGGWEQTEPADETEAVPAGGDSR